MEKAETGSYAEDASRYRPLCMIDTAGTILEKIICRRLETFLGEEGVSDHSFGFRKAQSIINVMEMVMAIGKYSISG